MLGKMQIDMDISENCRVFAIKYNEIVAKNRNRLINFVDFIGHPEL